MEKRRDKRIYLKDKNQNQNEIYEPNYEACKIQEEIKTDKNIPDFFNCNEVV